jgi:DNA processing protein
MHDELLYQLALTQVPQVGDVQAKLLVQHLGSASAVFKAPLHTLESIEGIGTVRARAIKSFRDFDAAEAEMQFIKKNNITPLFLTDAAYPQRLLHCADAPTLLFYKGTADLNVSRIVAIVGTRSNTDYGKSFTEKLVQDLAAQNILIVSGLAYGIDAFAHKAALKNGLQTVGVVGHGLDKVYPYAHTALAKEMMQHGGLLTEFFSGTIPDKHNFPLRNRVVAGLADATVVIETLVNGGSMITAKLADAYNRDVFAVPGRTIDAKSAGCNFLIQHNKAILLTEASQLLEVMGWAETKKAKQKQQRVLFIELTEDEKKIIALLQQQETVSLDEININSGLTTSAAAAAILNLELQNIVASLPGKMLKLL